MIHDMQLTKFLEKTPKKHLIFDFDETIAKIEIDWSFYFEKTGEIFAKFDPSRQHPAFKNFDQSNEFIKKYGAKVAALIKPVIEDFEISFNQGLTPYAELIDFIKNAQEYQLAVCSSNSRRMVVDSLKKLGIKDKFNQIVTRDEVTYIKPDPEGFSLIYDPAVPKEDYLMIGNSHADKGMAEAVGIDFYLVEYFRPI